MEKERNEYGPKILNKVWVFQGSAISALLFIIYLDDMTHDYKSLNDNKQIPRKHTYGRSQIEQCKLERRKITKSYTTQTGHQQGQQLNNLKMKIKNGPGGTEAPETCFQQIKILLDKPNTGIIG